MGSSARTLSIAAIIAGLYLLLVPVLFPPDPCDQPLYCVSGHSLLSLPRPSPELVGWLNLGVGVVLLVIGALSMLRARSASGK